MSFVGFNELTRVDVTQPCHNFFLRVRCTADDLSKYAGSRCHALAKPHVQPKLLVGYDLLDAGGGRSIPSPGSLGLLSYDTRTDAEPLVLDELGCKEGCSAFGQSTQARVPVRSDPVCFGEGWGGGGVVLPQWISCLSRVTVDHASLSTRSTGLLGKRLLYICRLGRA